MKNLYSHLTVVLFISIWLLSCSNQQSQKTDAWIPLFDGESFTGWKMYGSDSDTISSKWEIKDGMIIVSLDGNGPGLNTGFGVSLMTIEQFENFELELEFNVSEAGNSGVMYHVVEDTNNAMDYFTGHEFQVLDDYHFENQPREFQYTGSVFALYSPGTKTWNPAGEWNTLHINADNGTTEHCLTEHLALKFDRNPPT